MRVDQWLWAIRVYKTRSLSAEAIKSGRVTVNTQPAKPAREVRVGDVIAARFGAMTRTFRVLGIPPSRVGAKLVAQFSEEMTPEDEFAVGREQARADYEWRLHRLSGRSSPRE